jgi:hypothetical protein
LVAPGAAPQPAEELGGRLGSSIRVATTELAHAAFAEVRRRLGGRVVGQERQRDGRDQFLEHGSGAGQCSASTAHS